jgi:tetratricopeptide (TPR) repeat protein
MMTAAQNPQGRRPLGRRKRWLLAGLLLAVVVMSGAIALRCFRTSPSPPTPPEAKGDLLEPAVVTAIEVIRDNVLKDPNSARAWGDLGEVFLANELEEESSVCFAEAERLDPSNPRWPYFQSGPLLNRGEREAALTYLVRAVERYEAEGETATAPRLRLAETLLFLGRLDEAEVHIRRALDRQPEDPRVHFDLALLAISREDWETAHAHLLRCLGSPFTQQKARVQLAAVCSRLGDAPSADEFHTQAERLPPDRDWIDSFITEYLHFAKKKRKRYKLAEQFESAGRFRESVAVLRPLAADFPDDYLPQMTLGKILAQTGDYRGAEEALRKALHLAPEKVQTHYYLSYLLLKKGEEAGREGDSGRARAEELFREAASLARQALAIKPDYGYAHMALGLSLKHLGERAEALAALRQAVRCNPEFAELHFHLGEMLAEEGQAAEACPRLKMALQLAPPGVAWRPAAEARLAELKKGAGPDKPPDR